MAKESKAAHAADEKARSAPEGAGGMNTGVAVIGFLLCFLAGAGLMWGYDQHRLKNGDITADNAGSGASGGNWSDEESPIPVSSKDPTWGKRDAPVTVVIFSDYQCPFCSRVEGTLDQLRTQYGPDKLRFVWKNQPLPMHPNAKPAAEAAQGVLALAGNDAFWKFHDQAFKNQQQLTPDNFEKWAKDAGVKDLAKYKAGLAAHTWADKVEKDQAIAKQVGVNGTPAFFVNGVSLSGAQPLDKFKTVIDQEMGKAQAKIAGGTSKERVYVAMTQENKKAAPPAKEDEEDEKEDSKTVWRVPVGNSPMLGKADALVTIVEFSDFQCPYCSRVEPTLKTIRDKYGDKVRLVWKHEPLPFHPRAEPAAQLALEARAEKGDKGFWDAHDKLFENQKDLSDETLAKVAGDLGLNADKAKAAIKDHKYKKDIDADQEIAEDYQASGTPHFFVNGHRLVGAQPPEKFEKIIDDEIKHAQDLLAKGTPPAKLYDALVAEGKGPPEPEKKDIPKSLPTNDPSRGPASSKVVIHEWSDFQCPFCSRVEDTLKEVNKNYGDKVKFVWHDLPLPMHPDAPLASQAGREAYKQKGPDAFWKIHDKMFANQKELKRETLDGYAKELSLDMDKWKASLDNGTHKAEVDAAAKSGNDAGISGTPAFLIQVGSAPQGYFLSGAQPYAKFRKLIERALAEAH